MTDPAVAGLWLNEQMLGRSRILLREVPANQIGAYPVVPSQAGQAVNPPALLTSRMWSPALRWGLVRLMISAGDFSAAASMAEGSPNSYFKRGLPQYDALLAETIVLPERALARLSQQSTSQTGIPRVTSDAVVAGIHKFGASLTSSNASRSLVELLRPDDLAAAYAVLNSGETDAAVLDRARSRLTRYSKDAVLPVDSRLYPSIYATIPHLVSEGLWDEAETSVVVGRMLEDCVEPQAAARMLEELRRIALNAKELERLDAVVAACDNVSSPAGLIASAESGADDGRVLREVFDLTDPSLGEELLRNGDFSALSIPAMTPEWWRWACPQFPRGDEALMFHDRPSGRGDSGIAILGFWRDEAQPGVCGFYHASQFAEQLRPVTLQPRSAYLLAFDYRTEALSDGEAGIYIEAKPGVFYQAGLQLPRTKGCWHRFYVFGVNPSATPENILLMLYSGGMNGGIGKVEFNQVSLREVSSISLAAWASESTSLTHSESLCGAPGG